MSFTRLTPEERIAELRKGGRTIVFVSHDLAAVYRLCNRAILLDHGQVLSDGTPRAIIDQYQQMAFVGQGTSLEQKSDPTKAAECASISFSSPESAESVRTGYPMIARLGYRAARSISGAVFRISLYWPSGYLCAQLTNESSGSGLSLEPGAGTIEFHCPVLPVVPGLYRIDLSIESNGCEIDLRRRCATLCVDSGKPALGDFYIENSWKLVDEVSSAEDLRR